MTLPVLDADAAFLVYYNSGDRRTYQAVAEHFEVAYITVRRYADEYDWEGQADSIDEQARKNAHRKLAADLAKHRVMEINAAMTVQRKFMRRLMPSTADNPNPHEIPLEDLDPRTFIDMGKFIELMTGGATERSGVEDRDGALAEIERAIAEMDALETTEPPPMLTAGEETE